MLINLRNALMEGKRLPYDAEVEFLESTGTQWIDTGVAAFNWPYLEITCKVNQSYKTNYMYGIIGNSNGGSRWQGISPNSTTGVSFRGYDTSTTISESVTADFITLVSDGPNRMAYAGQSSATLLSGGVAGVTYGVWAYVGRVVPIAMSVASVKIGTSRDNLLFDGIPVRKGTVGYLYDRVSGALFGNAGTGDFVLGPDVVPVEWLDGGQLNGGIAFIDTGYTPNSSTKIESTAAILSASGYSGRFGNRSRLTFGCFTDGNLYLAQRDHYYLGRCTAGTFYSFVNDIPNRTVSVEGVGSTSTAAVSDWYPQLYPVYLFASNLAPLNNGTAVNNKILDTNSLGQIRMKSCDILENDIPVHSYRPVRVGTEGAMIDTLTRRIYRNQGTGAFTYGNDLKYPIPAE